VLHNIPTASNRSSADFLITSPLMGEEYTRILPDFNLRLRHAQQDMLRQKKEEE
jgi:methylglyoxal synthase